ncbi:epididymal secretory protein 4-like [Sphaerodactylus townsendi]|uniref:epididymal secretory protein 4-like n=1 Tax=Sphaerodactylus townsendi TaxID=933632 RepID=UPI002026C92D|nr:epididymal secretory protein 4-like [Sphaerodactylus townsendi]
MKSVLLLNAAILVHAGVNIPVQPNFDVRKITGRWYPIAVVLANAITFPGEPAANEDVVPLANGAILVTNSFMRNGICTKYALIFDPSHQPGKFLTQDRSSTLRMVEVKYNSHYILHVQMKNSAALHLNTRKLNGIDAMKNTFKQRAASMGFSVDDIQFLAPGGK